jgi:hypothetical protein
MAGTKEHLALNSIEKRDKIPTPDVGVVIRAADTVGPHGKYALLELHPHVGNPDKRYAVAATLHDDADLLLDGYIRWIRDYPTVEEVRDAFAKHVTLEWKTFTE